MKKFFAAFLMAMALPCFAVFQYDSITAVKNDIGSSSVGMVVAGGGFNNALQNSMLFNKNLYTYVTLVSGNAAKISSFGMYTINTDPANNAKSIGEKFNFVKIAGSENQYTAVDADGNPVKFDAGSEVGMWIESGDKTIFSTPGLADQSQHTYTDRITADDTYTAGFYGGIDGSTTWPDGNPGFQLGVNVGGTRPTPSGQPLPGVFATLLLGGAGAGIARLRGKRR